MELGEKILQARLAAGLSQRQLCGETITRNMLSLIEHGNARPSMGTLKILAARLGKPLSYFLDDQAADTAAAAEGIHLLTQAEEAIRQEKFVLARELLEKADFPSPDLRRRKGLLLARIPGEQAEKIVQQLPSLDEELLLRARAALAVDQWVRCLHLLEAMEDHTSPDYAFLMGELALRQEDYAAAAIHFHAAESHYPAETAPKLEQCYRELEDFKQAYVYACKQKK